MSGGQFGARLTCDGASFRLWAPAAKRVELLLDEPQRKSQSMAHGADGWFSIDVTGMRAGARYKFRIDDEIDVPDPASSFQPEDVFGPSELIDHASHVWRATDWRGRPWQDTVFIETHVGTFTKDGSYRAMIDRLDHLAATGITALELMPLADFAGTRNWGYDGVLWYAPDSAYGRPEDLKTLIDEAHLRDRPAHKQRGGWHARTDNSVTHSVRLFWHPPYIRTLKILFYGTSSTDLSDSCAARPHEVFDLGMRTWRIEARRQVKEPAMHRRGNTGTARRSIGCQPVDRDVFAAPRRNRAVPALAQRAMLATLAFERIPERPMALPTGGLRYRRTGGKRAGVSGWPESQLQGDSR